MIALAPLLLLIHVLATTPSSSPPRPSTDTVESVAPTSATIFDSAAQQAEHKPHVILSIDTVTVTDKMLYDTLNLMLTAVDVVPAGFSLKVAAESGLVDIIEILPGEIIDSCHWELFNAREISSDEPNLGPAEIWQIVALAQQVSNKKSLLCYGLKRPASLARLVVSSAHMAEVPDTTVGIFFYWESCRDNSVSDRRGSVSLMSASVEDRLPVRLTVRHTGFPTRAGAPNECVSSRVANPPKRAVSFQNGGVVFKYAPTSVDSVTTPR